MSSQALLYTHRRTNGTGEDEVHDRCGARGDAANFAVETEGPRLSPGIRQVQEEGEDGNGDGSDSVKDSVADSNNGGVKIHASTQIA